MSSKVGNLSIQNSDEKKRFINIGELYLRNKKLNFIKSQDAVLTNNKLLKEKIRKLEMATEEINNTGYFEIPMGGQSFSKDGSSIRSDGSIFIRISKSKEFRTNFSTYLFNEYGVEVKFQ